MKASDCAICYRPGNRKIGNTDNVSLLPIVTCPPGIPCARQCYARRLASFRPTVYNAWKKNTDLALGNLPSFTHEISSILYKRKPAFFRWHVGGDIPNMEYAKMTMELATEFPTTKFLAFTKTAFFTALTPPKNLYVRRSTWGDFDSMPNSAYSETRFIPRGETAPAGFVRCTGECEKCRACWSSVNVAIAEH